MASDLSMAARVTGIAAVVLGAAELLTWAANFGTTEAVVAAIGTEAVFWIFRSLWIVTLVATAVAVGGLIVGWRQAPLLWTPGIGQVVLGVVLRWGWWAVDRYVDVWGLRRFDGLDPSNPTDPTYQAYLETARASEWVDIAVGVVTIALLISGGIRLLYRLRSAE